MCKRIEKISYEIIGKPQKEENSNEHGKCVQLSNQYQINIYEYTAREQSPRNENVKLSNV